MAEILNEYFNSVFTTEDISSLPVPFTKFRGNKSEHLGQLFVTPEMIAKKMKDNKSPGVDGIPPKLLEEIVDQISTPLAKVFNLSLEEGIVPLEWKEANITPLFKKGSRNKPENYRPHQRLLLKLKAHGIGNDVINWIEKWLTHRRQRVIVDGEISNWKSVLSGVPQGSVLGPILFLIYINDLEDDISSKVLKFADDTKVFRKVTNDTDKQSLQDNLDKLVKWSEKWQMLLNFGKCKCIHIGHGNLDEEYKMGDAVPGRTTQEKDLGVTFSADMKVSEQCGVVASKGNQILGLIRRTITYQEKQLIVPLYKAIVRPHLEYCIQARRPYRKKDIDNLERIQ